MKANEKIEDAVETKPREKDPEPSRLEDLRRAHNLLRLHMPENDDEPIAPLSKMETAEVLGAQNALRILLPGVLGTQGRARRNARGSRSRLRSTTRD